MKNIGYNHNPIYIKFGENPSSIPLDYFPDSKGAKWFTLYRALNIELSNGEWIFVPAGFRTDLASVPKFLWSFFPPFGQGLMAYIVHDYLYVTKPYNRRFSDKEMLLWALELRSKKFDPWARYLTVRALGWLVWYKILRV